jgi:hypothetical protein
METINMLKRRVGHLARHLDERGKRLLAASEALRLGYGGVSRISRACGLSRVTITKGLRELKGKPLSPGRIRREGAGRPRITASDPSLIGALGKLVEPSARGDPESPLCWTCKSTRTLAGELTYRRHPISHVKVAQLLHDMNYSLQSNRKMEEGEDHPDRDAQFRYISTRVKQAMAHGLPVISVDTKKKEVLGNYANKGQQWRKAKTPLHVNGHDFATPEIPRAYPYGIYDMGQNTGFVNVGIDHDTGSFAVASIRGWWHHEGLRLYPGSKELLITADGGGSNGYRLRLWKLELQKLANETDLSISVCHFPPGTSKWNKVEHRLFSFISSNWRGEPLTDYETIVRLIAHTTTAKGLSVTCRLDRRRYPSGRRVSDDEFLTINLAPHSFHGEWNYKIAPQRNISQL